MPRPKTVQPQPLSKFSFSFYYGILLIEVEVRDGTCYLIYRGSHKRDAYNEKLWKVMEHVVNDYLSVAGKKLPRGKDYLSSATAFATAFATRAKTWGCERSDDKDGLDDSAIRKKLYPDVKRELKVFQNAIDEKMKNTNKGTSCAQTPS